MKTSTLIEFLAKDAGPAPRAVTARRLWPVAALGLLLSVAMAIAVIGPVPARLMSEPGMWLKMVYALALAVSGGWLVSRLARPVARVRAPRAVVFGLVLLMAVVGAVSLGLEPEGQRMLALMGHSALTCPWSVFALSLPALAGSFWALRGLAPTDLRRAGAAAGVFSGAVGSLGYSLTCTELSPAFVVVWYSAGIAAVGLLGAWLGPRLLRW